MRNRMRSPRTDDHASADVTELGLLAVVVLELVGLVVDGFDGLQGGGVFLVVLFHLLVVDEVHLGSASHAGEQWVWVL